MIDGFKEQGLRKRLVKQIQERGISDVNVLKAIAKIPRHFFLDNALLKFAYEDKAFPIGAGQTISQPYTVALQTQLLEIQKGDKILEVGTGSGYQTAVLLEMGAKVFTIERQRKLFLKTQLLLNKMGYHPRFFLGDGYAGKPTYGPFDKIIITAGANKLPTKLLEQLKPNGIMVIPLGENNQQMKRLIKQEDGSFTTENFGDCSFVPMLQGMANDV